MAGVTLRALLFEHGELLAEGETFEGDIASVAKEDSAGGKEGEDEPPTEPPRPPTEPHN